MAKWKAGDWVLAPWAGTGLDFVGTVATERDEGEKYLIVFEDGDVGVVDGARVRENTLGVDSRVFARWRDGRYYPGRIKEKKGRALYIDYDDGDGRWVPWAAIAVRQPAGEG